MKLLGSGSPLPRGRDTLLGLFSLAVLLVCSYYFVCAAYLSPVTGFDYDAQWKVVQVDNECKTGTANCTPQPSPIQVGDQLLQIGSLSREQFLTDRNAVAFAGARPGDLVPATLERAGDIQSVQVPVKSLSFWQRLTRMISISLMLPFWLVGSLALLFLRPRNLRWALLVATNYLTALWISTGLVSVSHVAGSSTILHATTWLMLPVYVHLHLLVPTALLARRWRPALLLLYILGILLALAEVLNLLPPSAFNLGLLLALGTSLGLLIYRSFALPRAVDRQSARLMLLWAALAFGPGLLVWVIPTLLHAPISSIILTEVTTAGLPLQPLVYLYVAYKRQMGNLEFRTNRFLTLYSFLLIFGTGFLLLFLTIGHWINLNEQGLPFSLFVSTAFVLLALWLRPPFERLINRLAYGTEHDPETIIRTFANQIPRALDREALARLLTREVSPALLVRQSALYAITGEAAPVVYAHGVAPYTSADLLEQLDRLLQTSGRYVPPAQWPDPPGPFGWVRLAIPIEVGGKRSAAWLLGKRDPDDYYPQPDIDLLTTLGNQVGVALETARLIESLQRRAGELETAYRDLQRLDELKDEFVQNVSHELRTPLTFLRGYTDLLLEELLGPLSQPQRDALQTMSDRTEGIIRLVNDIISVQQARAESPVQELVNLPALACSCVEAAEIATRKQDAGGPVHEFRLDLADNIPPIIGDRRRLAQVFDNLLGNAIKFSPKGGSITVRIAPYPYPRPGIAPADTPSSGVALEVSDQGIGIPPGEIERIWQRFYQVDGSSTRRFGGMGLGLAIVRSIVESQGGSISVESQVGQGSTFRVVLPVRPAGQAAAQPSAQAPAQAPIVPGLLVRTPSSHAAAPEG